MEIDTRLVLDHMEATTPLAEHVNEYLNQPELKRRRNLAKLFSQFHLKKTVTSDVNGRWIELNGKRVLNFGSANYLGFDQHPEIIDAAVAGVRRWGNHAGCSRIFSSQSNILQLESALARLVRAEKALVGLNVSMVHQMIIPTLFSSSQVDLLIDRHAHTSMFLASQAAQAGGARLIKVDITNKAELKRKMRSSRRRKVLLIDGIYSMQGHCPDLKFLSKHCDSNNTILYIDDAHGIGVLGPRGGGVVEEFQLGYDNLILIGSLQKGLGCHGGFLAAKAAVVDSVRVMSKAYIFTGPPQAQAVESALKAVQLCQDDTGVQRRQYLSEWSHSVREQIHHLGFRVPKGHSPIVPVAFGSDLRTLMAGRKLFDLGIYLNSVVFPAVPRGQGILRISLTALHQEKDFLALIKSFEQLRQYIDEHKGWIKEPMHQLKEVIKSKWLGESYPGL